MKQVKWININDRKPPVNQNVYIAHKLENSHAVYVARRVYWGSLEVEMFLSGSGCDTAMSEVTHWASIPTPVFEEQSQ